MITLLTWELVLARRDDEGFRVATPEVRAAYVSLVREMAEAAPAGRVPPDAGTRAAALGLTVTVEGTVAWLMEPPDDLHGAGVLALRLGPLPAELVLQAPHPTSDRHTGPVAAALFDAGDIRAAFISTVHRDAAPGSDTARAPESWLTAATIALAEALPDPLFVQLHGHSPETSEADAVVSEGSARMPPAELYTAARRIAQALGVADVRTGEEVRALAARGNAQGLVIGDRARFLHVEMSATVRERLAGDAALRASLGDALLLQAARKPILP